MAVTTPIGHAQWNAAASAASATSGYDAYGNLFAEVTQTDDGGTASNSAGYTPVVATHTRVVSRCFARDDSSACSTVSVPGPDAGSWWIRRLRREDTSDSITYSSDHPLPAGALAPTRTLGRAWTYNATTRLPLTERVYPDLATTPSLTTTTVYDASHGQPTSITLTPSQFTAGSTATTIGYSADGYFAQSRTNAYGHTNIEERRDQDGGVTRSVDADGLITKFTLDGWGRVKQIEYRNSGDTANRLPKREIAHTWGCGSACPSNSIYQVTEVQPGTPSVTSSVDSVGRSLRVDTKLEDNSTSRVDTGYDARGFMTRQEMPHRPTETAYATTWSGFDIAGRPGVKTIQRTGPSDALGNLVVRYTYSGRQTAIRVQGSNDFTPLTTACLPTQFKCLDMTRLVDAFGRIVRTIDASGGRVRYWFDGTGNAVAIEDPLSPNPAITTATYNSLGHRLSTTDPDRGTFQWTYDGLGNVLTQTDPRRMSTLLPGMISTTYSYDALGRRTGRIGSLDFDGGQASAETVTDTWIYDPPVGTAKGQLFQSSRSVYYPAISTSVLEKRTTHEYDSLARRTRSTTDQLHPDNVRESLATSVIYDGNYGRPKAEVHPTGDVRWLQYSRYGHLNREQSLSGVIYWATQTVDARGQPLTALQGPISRTATYDPASGQVSSLIYRNGPTTLRQLHYYYDVYDNVALAQMGGGTTSETYAYDKLLRLTSATRSGGAVGTTTYGYDAAGSFRFKSDQSTVTSTAPHAYQYGSGNQPNVATDAGPHAVTRVSLATAYGGGTRNLSYDDAGNLVSAGNTGSSLGADLFTARYDHDHLPVYLHRNGRTSLLSYGPDGERTRQTATEGNWTYVGAFERSVVGTVSERRVYLGNHTQLSTRAGSTGVDIRYLLTDRLGSVDAVVDAGGIVRETRGYDPFGKPRQGTWADASPAALPSVERTTKGFTQHVHLDGQRLIHMNGRAYDYQLGRFLSVDPVIQFPTNSQSLNPYSYILNNPLSGTDPTGFFSKSLCSHASNFSSSGTCGNDLALRNNLESTPGRKEARNSSSGGDNRQGTEGTHGRKSDKAPLSNKLDFRNGVQVAQNGTFTPQQACAQYADMCPAGQEAGVPDAIRREVQEPIDDAADVVDTVATGAAKEILTAPVTMTAPGMFTRVGRWLHRILSFRSASVADDVVVVTAGGAAMGVVRATELLRPGGQLIGKAGDRHSIRVLEGGTAQAEKLFQQLSAGGRVVTPPFHPGTLIELPGGGFVGYRPVSTSGPPTIDVNIPGLAEITKIKFVQ